MCERFGNSEIPCKPKRLHTQILLSYSSCHFMHGLFIIASQDTMLTSLPSLIPLRATSRITFNNPWGHVTALFKKPWIQLPQPGDTALPTGCTFLLTVQPSEFLQLRPFVSLRRPYTSPSFTSAWPPHCSPLWGAHSTHAVLSLLSSLFSQVHLCLKAWLLHSDLIQYYLVLLTYCSVTALKSSKDPILSLPVRLCTGTCIW